MALHLGALCKTPGTSFKGKATVLGRDEDSDFDLQYWLRTWE